MYAFAVGHGRGTGWKEVVAAALGRMGEPPAGGNLGFVYFTDPIADDLPRILERLRERTGVSHWVGSVGMGICATGIEYHEEPALALMVGAFPADSFRVFPALQAGIDELDKVHGPWVDAQRPYLAVVHGDPRNSGIGVLVELLSRRLDDGFLVGGLASSRGRYVQVADTPTQGGLSGVLFTPDVPVSTRVTQGCSPIGPRREVTEAERNILVRIDGRRALEVFKQDIGEVLARDLGRTAGYIFAGLPIGGSDTGDYLVRNLVGIDPEEGLIAIGEWVQSGQKIMFCRRDARTAREDLTRMLEAHLKAIGERPKAALYHTCLGRGGALFGAESGELRLIEKVLGDVPLVGFYANGEISNHRLYGYTGVLTLFL